jgi:hypothetical protein
VGVCRATKRNGEPCTLPATGKHGFCWAHDPSTAQQRRTRASRGGRGKAAKRVAVLWDEVRSVIDGVESERLAPPQANSMVRAYNTLIALSRHDIERAELEITQQRLELDLEERRELRGRLEELESVIEGMKHRGTWGA